MKCFARVFEFFFYSNDPINLFFVRFLYVFENKKKVFLDSKNTPDFFFCFFNDDLSLL